MFDFLGRPRGAAALASASAIALIAAASPAYAQEQTRAFDIPAQSLSSALIEFSRQAGVRVTADPNVINGRQAPALVGNFTPRAGLEALLVGSGLLVAETESSGLAVQDPNSPTRLGDVRGAASSEDTAEILVTGRRTLNTDIRRSEDDVLPYVTFSSEEIARSGASNLEELFRTRLPMNTQALGRNQTTFGGLGVQPAGGITLRGLSPDQTLILVDGRRLPGVALGGGGGVGQPNITGIPVSAIDRIEVLPASAGGIYGGGATAGVINIVLRRDYAGLDIQADYGNTFDTDVGYTNLAVTGGVNLNSGRTNVMFSASQSQQNSLDASDRTFREDALRLFDGNSDFGFVPLGRVANFCGAGVFSDCDSATSLTFDPAFGGGAYAGTFASIPDGYAGPTADGIGALNANANVYDLRTPSGLAAVLSAPATESFTFSVRHAFTQELETFLDAGRDFSTYDSSAANFVSVRLAADDPNNPFQQDITSAFAIPNSRIVAGYESQSDRLRGGMIWRGFAPWTLSFEHSWGRSLNSVFESGRLNFGEVFSSAYLRSIALSDLNTHPADLGQLPSSDSFHLSDRESVSNDTVLRFAGPLFHLPAGPVAFSGYLEHRREELEPFLTTRFSAGTPTYTLAAAASQEVNSAYVEARAPIIVEAQNVPFIHLMDLFAAVRRDEYETTGSASLLGASSSSPNGPFAPASLNTNEVESTNFTLGVRYAPTPDVAFRISYGTGFLPPSVAQLWQLTGTGFAFDARRGGEFVFPQVTDGAGPDLRPEESETLSAGLIFTPRFLPGLRASLDFSRIQKTDEIYFISAFEVVGREDLFPGRVVRDTDPSTFGPYGIGPILSVDATSLNVASLEVEAFDIQLDYELTTQRLGVFRPYLIATWQRELSRTILAGDPSVDSVGLSGGPLEWRGNVGLAWNLGGISAGWDAQVFDSYSVCSSFDSSFTCSLASQEQGSESIPEQIYHDVFVSYDFGASEHFAAGPLADTEIRLVVQNLMDEAPPTVTGAYMAQSIGGGYSTYGDPRMRRFMLTLRKHF